MPCPLGEKGPDQGLITLVLAFILMQGGKLKEGECSSLSFAASLFLLSCGMTMLVRVFITVWQSGDGMSLAETNTNIWAVR